MTPSRGTARITLTAARWLLPWIAVLLVSTSFAYAATNAVYGGASASAQAGVHTAQSTGDSAPAADLDQSTTSLSEMAIGSSRGASGVMSLTSPASTGHASPNGCCTWD
jgi:hypothetical protein